MKIGQEKDTVEKLTMIVDGKADPAPN